MRLHEGASLIMLKISTGISVPKRTLEPMIWLVDVFTVYNQTEIKAPYSISSYRITCQFRLPFEH